MNRVRKTSWWSALLVGGVLLALPAAAANKTVNPDQCKGECFSKANTAMNACIEACPKTSGTQADMDKTKACLSRCSDKLEASMQACDKSCPSTKKEQVH